MPARCRARPSLSHCIEFAVVAFAAPSLPLNQLTEQLPDVALWPLSPSPTLPFHLIPGVSACALPHRRRHGKRRRPCPGSQPCRTPRRRTGLFFHSRPHSRVHACGCWYSQCDYLYHLPNVGGGGGRRAVVADGGPAAGGGCHVTAAGGFDTTGASRRGCRGEQPRPCIQHIVYCSPFNWKRSLFLPLASSPLCEYPPVGIRSSQPASISGYLAEPRLRVVASSRHVGWHRLPCLLHDF